MLAALKMVDTSVDDLSFELVDLVAPLETMKPGERPIKELFLFMEQLLGSKLPAAKRKQWLAALARIAADKNCSADAHR
jgi:hypothetical protein